MNEKYKPCVQHKYGSQCINGKRLKVSCGRIAPPSQRYGFYKQYGTNNDTALFNNLHNLREFCNRFKPHVFKMQLISVGIEFEGFAGQGAKTSHGWHDK